jgi:hypothetical protein
VYSVFVLSEIVFVSVFLLDYILRLLAFGLPYALSWSGCVDVVTTLPAIGMLVADTSDPNLDVSGDAGLGSAASMALRKLVRAVDRHPLVFEALRRFVAAEHRLTFVVGNHDLELHWPVVQLALREAVVASVAPSPRARLIHHVQIEPIFFWAEGALFVEHGHRYDPTCVGVAPLAPHSPLARDRMLPSLADVLLRLIVRRVEHIDEHGHENEDLAYYLKLIARTGLHGIGNLARSFFHAIGIAVKTWWHLVRGGLRSLRRLHRQRLRGYVRLRRGPGEEGTCQRGAYRR